MSFFNEVNELLIEFLNNVGILAPLFCCALIFLEAILAFLPLFVFVTVNILSLSNIFGQFVGTIIGFSLSWIFTILGSFTVFLGIRKLFSDNFRNKIKKKKKINKFMFIVDHLKYSQLVLIISIPFSPSFFINLGAGLSKINYKKYFSALIIGKFVQVIFLSFVGVSLVECLSNPLAFIKVILIVLFGYVLSVIINKRFNLDERFE